MLEWGFCSAGLGQPERLSLISQLAEQDKQVNKSLLCKLFGVMKSSYYYGRHPKPISLETVKTKASVRQIFNDSKRSAGARSIAAIIMNEHNIKLSRYMVGKLMAQMGLKSCQLKTHKYKHADEAHKMHHNILNRNFNTAAPNQVWTGDVHLYSYQRRLVLSCCGIRFICSAYCWLCCIRFAW